MNLEIPRRQFLGSAHTTAASLALARKGFAQSPASPANKVTLAIAGLGGRGLELINQFAAIPGVSIKHVIDVDARALPKAVNAATMAQGYDFDNKPLKSVGAGVEGKGNLANSTDPELNDTHALSFIGSIRGNARLNSPIDQGHCSTVLAQLGNIAHRAGRSLKTDPGSGRILDDPQAAKLWTRDYEPGWNPTI